MVTSRSVISVNLDATTIPIDLDPFAFLLRVCRRLMIQDCIKIQRHALLLRDFSKTLQLINSSVFRARGPFLIEFA